MHSRSLRSARLALVAAVLALAALAATAVAATKNGITPVSPKKGSTAPAGKALTFKMKSKGPGQVWVHVCKSPKKKADGVICNDETLGRAKKKGSTYQYRQKVFNFPEYFLVRGGTFYWQAHRIDCSEDINDCLLEGPVVKFKVG